MSFGVKYALYICDKDYVKQTRLNYTFLQYSQVISAVPQAYFTFQNQDPNVSNNLIDFINQAQTCIIEREGVEVFRGEIDLITTPGNNTPIGVDSNEAYGSLDHIGINASHLVQRMGDIIVTPDSDSATYKRSFNNIDLGTIVSTLITEAKDSTKHPYNPLASLSAGTIEYPKDASGNLIKLQSSQALYSTSYLDWIRTLSSLVNFDWYVDITNKLNYVKWKGVDRRDSVVMSFKNGFSGNNLTGITLNIDRQKMANKVIVLGAQDGINQVVKEASDVVSLRNFYLRETAAPVRLLDTADTAQIYANSLLLQYSQKTPAGSFTIYPDQSHRPFGEFDLGDTITIDVDMNCIRFRKAIRVKGAVISVEPNGVERVYYQLEETIL